MVNIAEDIRRKSALGDYAYPKQTSTVLEDNIRDFQFSTFLNKFELSPVLRGPWAVVKTTQQTQGWKIHISSIPTQAIKLLNIIIPYLKNGDVSFKVAKDMRVLSQLNEGDLGGTQIGKFMTIYPNSDVHAKQLAHELRSLTQGYNGPVIVTDLRLGDVLYARYGGFNPVITRDRLGQVFLSIYTSDGRLRTDSYVVPFVIPDGIVCPFDDHTYVEKNSHETTTNSDSSHSFKSSKLFGPGYLVLELVKEHPKGSVFRGIDLRSQEQVSVKILKQGRQYCLSDEYERDMRTRLKRQEKLHADLFTVAPIPKVDPYFEINGDGYLPVESIDGQSLESLAVTSLAGRPWVSLSTKKKNYLLNYVLQFLSAVQKLNSAGYVHRDLTASNIWIGTDERVYLLDLELAHAIDDSTPAFGLGTPGFMSPQQEARMRPTFADDIYALGCCMILVLTGIDPRRILFANEKDRIIQLQALTGGGAPDELLAIVAQSVSFDPTVRPSISQIISSVQNSLLMISASDQSAGLVKNSTISSSGRTIGYLQKDVIRLILGGQQGLLEDVARDPSSGLWLSATIASNSHQARNKSTASYEIRRSANRGVAGVVYLLSRLTRLNYGLIEVRGPIQNAVQWLITKETTPDQQLPGLHFGEVGVAVAIGEAIASNLVERNADVDKFLIDALSGVLDWPDITHGAAGQGIGALYCFDRLKDDRLLLLTHRCARYLVDTQKNDGSWEMPAGVDGMSGETLTGFAHGVSGIVYFLAEYARRFGSREVQKAWEAGAEWIIKQSISVDGGKALEWSYSNIKPAKWKWWCHGSPGIALTFLRLYEQTKEREFADLAAKALQIHQKDLLYPNLSQCHGLSGLGEIYLEAARVLGNPEWFSRAEWIANTLKHFRRENDTGSVTWLVEDPHIATGDLMVGSGSVVHFLLRFSLKGEKIGFPLLLDGLSE